MINPMPISLKRPRFILRTCKNHYFSHSPPSMPMPMDDDMVMVMMMMMKNNTHQNPPFNTWKLYENPFYISSNPNAKPYFNFNHSAADHHPQIHRLHLPLSARKIASSFWDLSFLRPPIMDHSELDKARARIAELKVELECESKARRKSEGLNRRLAREVSDERKARQALEKVCGDLAREISAERDEMNRMRREFEEERRMMRTAEVIREERVQMKLAEARFLLEEKLSELENSAGRGNQKDGNFGIPVRAMVAEYKNPHIRRGIKGFVEFPRVVRAMGCRRGKKNLGSKLECQKAQLKILLKQKSIG